MHISNNTTNECMADIVEEFDVAATDFNDDIVPQADDVHTDPKAKRRNTSDCADLGGLIWSSLVHGWVPCTTPVPVQKKAKVIPGSKPGAITWSPSKTGWITH